MQGFVQVVEVVAGRLGIIKNQLLVFSVVASFLIFVFAKDLAVNDNDSIRQAGVTMFGSAIALLFLAFFFYVYAWLKLPASDQEIVFEQEGRETVTQHRERKSRNKQRDGKKRA